MVKEFPERIKAGGKTFMKKREARISDVVSWASGWRKGKWFVLAGEKKWYVYEQESDKDT